MELNTNTKQQDLVLDFDRMRYLPSRRRWRWWLVPSPVAVTGPQVGASATRIHGFRKKPVLEIIEPMVLALNLVKLLLIELVSAVFMYALCKVANAICHECVNGFEQWAIVWANATERDVVGLQS
jgi:hypothetical protein